MSIMVFSQCQLASLPMFANRQYSTFVRERAKSIQLWPTYNHVRLSFIKFTSKNTFVFRETFYVIQNVGRGSCMLFSNRLRDTLIIEQPGNTEIAISKKARR